MFSWDYYPQQLLCLIMTHVSESTWLVNEIYVHFFAISEKPGQARRRSSICFSCREAQKTSAWKYLCVSVAVKCLHSHQSRCLLGLCRWCSRRWKDVSGSCCPRRMPWRWTGPGVRHLHSSSPTSSPLAGRSGRLLPLWSGACVKEGIC